MSTRDEAITAAARILRDVSAERDQLAAAEGPRAVAEAAHWCDAWATVDQIEAHYEHMQRAAQPKAA